VTTLTYNLTETFPLVGDGLDAARSLYQSGEYEQCVAEARAARLGTQKRAVIMAAVLLESSAQFDRGLYGEALRALNAGSEIIESVSPLLKAKFFAQRAVVRRKRNDKKKGDKDQALVDYEAARYWAEEAGNEMVIASIQNNLAKLYSEFDRYDDAIEASNAAIETAEHCGASIWLGRFYDQRSQILIDAKNYAQALQFSEKAMGLLAGHPSEEEARETHGRALIGLGSSYLEHEDPLESLRSRRAAAKIIESSPDDQTIQLALDRTDGRIRQAAILLGMQHSALIKLVQQKGFSRHPQRYRGKSIFTK
jgi:tetratricopeptide (TPR) repeat protein